MNSVFLLANNAGPRCAFHDIFSACEATAESLFVNDTQIASWLYIFRDNLESAALSELAQQRSRPLNSFSTSQLSAAIVSKKNFHCLAAMFATSEDSCCIS